MRFPAIVALALVFAPTASAKTLTLNWVEKTSVAYGYPPMTFTVKSVTVNRSSWSVRATILNRSRHDIWVRPNLQPDITNGGARFGLLKPPSNCQSVTGNPVSGNCLGAQALLATSFTPALPSHLRAGTAWSGSFAGTGTLPRGKLISVTFGAFYSVEAKRNFSWTSQHEFKL